MLIKRIALKNIRSYNDGEETEVEIPEGIVLFEGDVGSGKSTLLYAIEFALFGFSDMKGAHLLSEGRKEGHVEVGFVAEGKEYLVRRGLKKRGEDVVQEECFISVEGSWMKLSPSDLKQKIVAVLKFNEPTHPRAESLVYRYAVFTPQEQMKEILFQNADTRLQVIRRVLGVQSYQVAADNSDAVARKVGEMSFGLKRASDDLEDTKSELEEKSKTLTNLDSKLPALREDESEALRSVEKLESEWKELRDKREQMSATTGRIPDLKKRIDDLESQQREDQEKICELEDHFMHEIKPIMEAFESKTHPMMSSKALDSELDGTRNELLQLKQNMAVLEAQLEDFREIVSKGVCPVCGQNIPQGFSAKSDHAMQEAGRVNREITRLEQLVSTLTLKAMEAREFEEEERGYRKLARESAGTERDVSRLRTRLAKTTGELPNLKAELEEASDQAESMKGLSGMLEELDAELTKARDRSKTARDALTRAETQRAEIARESDRLSKALAEKEAMRLEARRLLAYRNWLDGFFRPTVELIEKQTLTQANSRFNYHFQRFFTSLVDDQDMVVRVKEDFSPVFERQGFEQDFDALSGGERTSMALAYRFALNSVVREDITAQTELVILDEPTDGFSKEQIYKMRDLLEELDSRQVILVSHEKELESMANRVFRVDKINGTSRVKS